MGHLTLISEDVIGALEHFPPDLRLLAAQYAPQPEWDEYVTGRYKETKKKDSSLLGGGKPVIAPGMRNGTSQWQVDEADAPKGEGGGAEGEAGGSGGEREGQEGQPPDHDRDRDRDQEMGGMTGELKRDVRTAREVSADFGAMVDDEDAEYQTGPPHVRDSAR